ncbi:MAG: hypothetical protein WC785_07660 [Tatlockia sp.]
MTVIFFSEDEQANFVNLDNTSIPKVPRNRLTGWPLLEASKLEKSKRDYQCSAFNLAALLAKLPGEVTITGNGLKGCSPPNTALTVANELNYFSNVFSFHNERLQITIKLEPHPNKRLENFKQLSISLPECETARLRIALYQPMSFFIPESKVLIPTWHNEVTCFNGKVYIDLGAYLESEVTCPRLTKYFEELFQVNTFSQLHKTKEDELNLLEYSRLVFGTKEKEDEIDRLIKNFNYPHTKKYRFLNALEALSHQLLEEDTPTKEIVTCFQKLLTQLNDPNKPLTKEKMAKSFYQLDKKLTQLSDPKKPLTKETVAKSFYQLNKKPSHFLSPCLIGAICGAILGLVGLISGGIIGALATSWGGGFGAFAAAAAGGVVGVKAGMAIGSVAGGLTGFSIGFFNRREQLIAKTQDALCDELTQTKFAMLDLIKR